jgi:NAD(P)-dependent dehydrogenase (short-subunit alcohol dehydrogenase family)
MSLLRSHAALAGKTAVIVGGATGVGRGITLALAEAGVGIATCDFDEQGAREIVTEVESLGSKILSVHADVRNPAALERFFDRVEAEFDRVDILVNVAGGVKRDLFMDTARAQNKSEIRLNYGYILDSVRRAIPLIRKSGQGGSIVNFTTIEAHRGAAGFAVYAGAKAATTNFSRALAVELGAELIRVNTIAPDTTPSRTSSSARGPEFMARYNSLTPAARAQALRMYVPQKKAPAIEDLANAVLFLVSDLSRAITGITLHVDGGTMASSGFTDWPHGDGYGAGAQPETLRRLFDSDEQGRQE